MYHYYNIDVNYSSDTGDSNEAAVSKSATTQKKKRKKKKESEIFHVPKKPEEIKK